ncbi:MAG: hydantoinase B/oxoprolinase family protein [Saprospiraceae bacterium]
MKIGSKLVVGVDVGGSYCDGYMETDGKISTVKLLSTGRLRAIVLNKIDDYTWRLKHNWTLPHPNVLDGCFAYTGEKNNRVKTFDQDYTQVIFDKPMQLVIGKSIEFGIHAEAPVLAAHLLSGIPVMQSLDNIELRVGTTRGTNVMLEHKGVPCIWITNKGFKDLLYIKTQQRPSLFQLQIPEPDRYYFKVLESTARLDAQGRIRIPLDEIELNHILSKLPRSKNIPIAISFLHSYKNPEHEFQLKQYLTGHGYTDVSCSHELHPSIHILPRSETTVCNAYLNPIMKHFTSSIQQKVKSLYLITSAGLIKPSNVFYSKDALLSGPAGGVKAAERISIAYKIKHLITIDMGGTSTDSARIDGQGNLRFRSRIGSTEISSPSYEIETVAAGGGSIIDFKHGKFIVGPESAGAFPGPACYGYGGPFTLTDLQLLQGKLVDHAFNIPIYREAAENKFKALLKKAKINKRIEQCVHILSGIEQIANETMAEAIRKISLGQGYNPGLYTLLVFGGAGGLHACNISEILGIKNILIPKYAGILSAYGIANTSRQSLKIRQVNEPLEQCQSMLQDWYGALFEEAKNELSDLDPSLLNITSKKIYLKYLGQTQTITIEWNEIINPEEAFNKAYFKIHRTTLHQTIEVESISISVQPVSSTIKTYPLTLKGKKTTDITLDSVSWNAIKPKEKLLGPKTIYSNQATVFIESGWSGVVQQNGDLYLSKIKHSVPAKSWTSSIELELFSNRFKSIAEQMGAQLQFSAFSVNVKERLDFSCAILDPKARLIANAPHIPVHLGSLGICARMILKKFKLAKGDVIICNHPMYGGSHLPDITLIKAVYAENKLIGYVINRAHHAEIGGLTPGSMPPFAKNLSEEGVIFPPVYLMKNGKLQWSLIEKKLKAPPYPSRNPRSNVLDIQAALLALYTGEEKLLQMNKQYGHAYLIHQMDAVLNHSRKLLQTYRASRNNFNSKAIEYMDDGSKLEVKILITKKNISFDFTGTGATHPGNLNANQAIVHSVILYVLRLIVNENIPLNEGLSKDIKVILPDSFINPVFSDDPLHCPAVVGGNTEVSQRLTDTLIKAFKLAACSQGTMNNFLFGNDRYSYYETIGGGVGAGPGYDGRSAIHQHMTNTKITDPEELELRYPVFLDLFEIRKHSGGIGKYKGGDGIRRQLTFQEPMTVTILAQHRVQKPFGSNGGGSGKTGKQFYISSGISKSIQANEVIEVKAGDSIKIETPGGGGWGKK